MFKKIIFTALAFSALSLPALAKEFEFVKIAEDANGDPVMIDTKSIHGDNFTLYRKKDGQLVEALFDASCPAGRVWIRRVTMYSSGGTKLAEDTDLKEMPASASTPSGAGLRYFCRSFKVPGY